MVDCPQNDMTVIFYNTIKGENGKNVFETTIQSTCKDHIHTITYSLLEDKKASFIELCLILMFFNV